jgi:hypothetical protein
MDSLVKRKITIFYLPVGNWAEGKGHNTFTDHDQRGVAS